MIRSAARSQLCHHELLRAFSTSAAVRSPSTRRAPSTVTRYRKADSPPPVRRQHDRKPGPSTAYAKARSPRTQPESSPVPTSEHGEKRLLLPYELSRRLINLCEEGSFDQAVEMLKNSPNDAQNVKVWNTLIQQCMSVGKYKLAYSLFVDMGRRGFKPSFRTYGTMMSGYARIEDWSKYSKQLENVDAVYQRMIDYLQSSRDLSRSERPTYLFPVALYIEILGNAGRQQDAFDVFHELPQDGLLSPNDKIYSSLLSAVAKHSPSSDSAEDKEATREQSINEVTYVWRRITRSAELEPNFTLTVRAVEAVISVLATGKSAEQKLLFEIIREYFGLTRPMETGVTPKLELNHQAFSTVLRVVPPALCEHYVLQCLADRTKSSVVRPWHILTVLRTLSSSAHRQSDAAARAVALLERVSASDAPHVSVHRAFYELALSVCAKCADWPRALALFEKMTGCSTALGEAGRAAGEPFSSGEWKHMFRAALNTADREAARDCLRLFDAYGGSAEASSNEEYAEMRDLRAKTLKFVGSRETEVKAKAKKEETKSEQEVGENPSV